MKKEKLLREFIEWAESCGGDSFYIFDEPEEAIKLFLKQRKVRESDPEDDHIQYEESPFTSPKIIDKRPKRP